MADGRVSTPELPVGLKLPVEGITGKLTYPNRKDTIASLNAWPAHYLRLSLEIANSICGYLDSAMLCSESQWPGLPYSV